MKQSTSYRLQGYADLLKRFDYSICHIQGKDNIWADLISRMLKSGNGEKRKDIRVESKRMRRPTEKGKEYQKQIRGEIDNDDDEKEEENGNGHREEKQKAISQRLERVVNMDEVEQIRDPLLPDQKYIERYRTLPNLPSLLEIARSQEKILRSIEFEEEALKEKVESFYGTDEVDGEEVNELFDEIADDRAVVDRVLRRGLGISPLGKSEMKLLVVRGTKKVWIPQDDERLIQRMLACAHLSAAGHRGIEATLNNLAEDVEWTDMKKRVKSYVLSCLHCIDDGAGFKIPRPMGDGLRVFARNEAIHMDYLFLGESTEEWGGYKWVLVIMDGFTKFVMLTPCKEPNAEVSAQGILHWYSMFGIVRLIISDQGSHFKNNLLSKLTHLLGVGQRFISPYASWSNGVIERMNREVIRIFKALVSEHGVSTDNWAGFIQIVEYALNFAYRERIKCSPAQLQTGVDRGRVLDVWLKEDEKSEIAVGQINEEFATKQVEELKELIEEYSERAATKMRDDIKKWRLHGPKGNKLFDFEVGDLVLVASTKGQIEANKLRPIWQGPYKVAKVMSKYKYLVKDVVNGMEMERHVAFIRHYADQNLHLDANIKAVIAEHKGLLKISKILAFGEGDDGEYLVKVQWEGLEGDYDDWQSVKEIFKDAPQMIVKAMDELLEEEDKRNMKRSLQM
jgi:transposase InsO family protein